MTPFPSTVYRSLAAVLILLTLPACRDNTESLWQDYSARLERVTAQNFIAPDYRPEIDQNLNAANRPEALEARLPLLESLGLMHCRLGELIATHNSSLGRVAEPSELLKYQLAFSSRADLSYRRQARKSDQTVADRSPIAKATRCAGLVRLDASARQGTGQTAVYRH